MAEDRLYVKLYYLKIAHYMYFAMGVFSLTAAIIFWNEFPDQSLYMLLPCLIYSGVSMWSAYYFYRDYRHEVEPLIFVKNYVLPYMVLALWTLFMTVLMIYLVPFLKELMYSFLFINYYFFFVLVVGVAVSRFGVIKQLFHFYSTMNLKRGLSIASRGAMVMNLSEYVVGTDEIIDGMLDEILTEKKHPGAKIRMLEIELCKKHIREIDRELERLQGNDVISAQKNLIEILKSEREDYVKKLGVLFR